MNKKHIATIRTYKSAFGGYAYRLEMKGKLFNRVHRKRGFSSELAAEVAALERVEEKHPNAYGRNILERGKVRIEIFA